jgi:hypothetical protein
MDFKTYAKLDEMKSMARGNPAKLANVAVKQREYNELKAAVFNEEFPFVNGFSESHLESLKSYAEENPEDESAQIRYALQKERFEVQQAKKSAHIDFRMELSSLRKKIASDEPLSKRDLLAAERIAKKNTSPENIALYVQVKQQTINEGGEQ